MLCGLFLNRAHNYSLAFCHPSKLQSTSVFILYIQAKYNLLITVVEVLVDTLLTVKVSHRKNVFSSELLILS